MGPVPGCEEEGSENRPGKAKRGVQLSPGAARNGGSHLASAMSPGPPAQAQHKGRVGGPP
ncbi:hypothetical protein A6R68_03848 [Neotoma lepida]|uniref:Uncharacterized protein n=1 Tax=Neotoma lepida TaxID=56216 RepID=A0A1A6GPG3_NEOLE|nr:hypothetical protein A6R68_03848 [Neotoma lepida]